MSAYLDFLEPYDLELPLEIPLIPLAVHKTKSQPSSTSSPVSWAGIEHPQPPPYKSSKADISKAQEPIFHSATMFSYLLYSASFFFFLIIGILYLTRSYWLPYLPAVHIPFLTNIRVPFIYDRLPTSSTFADDAAHGMHSSTFDLSGNIESGDGRAGLDERGKKEVQRMMRARGVGFDEARRLVVMERFKRAGVGEDGRPRDPKFVSFS